MGFNYERQFTITRFTMLAQTAFAFVIIAIVLLVDTGYINSPFSIEADTYQQVIIRKVIWGVTALLTFIYIMIQVFFFNE